MPQVKDLLSNLAKSIITKWLKIKTRENLKVFWRNKSLIELNFSRISSNNLWKPTISWMAKMSTKKELKLKSKSNQSLKVTLTTLTSERMSKNLSSWDNKTWAHMLTFWIIKVRQVCNQLNRSLSKASKYRTRSIWTLNTRLRINPSSSSHLQTTLCPASIIWTICSKKTVNRRKNKSNINNKVLLHGHRSNTMALVASKTVQSLCCRTMVHSSIRLEHRIHSHSHRPNLNLVYNSHKSHGLLKITTFSISSSIRSSLPS